MEVTKKQLKSTIITRTDCSVQQRRRRCSGAELERRSGIVITPDAFAWRYRTPHLVRVTEIWPFQLARGRRPSRVLLFTFLWGCCLIYLRMDVLVWGWICVYVWVCANCFALSVYTYIYTYMCVCTKNTIEKSTIYHHIKRTKTNIIENGRRGMGEIA